MQNSHTPGEIEPAKISISGGLHYQNLFTLDGFSINNDLDPGQSGSSWYGAPQGRSQGLAIDTNLLESITVQDSNIAAAYGGVTGGVVEAKTKKPTKPFGATISYQFTQGDAVPGNFSLTKYKIAGDKDDLNTFIRGLNGFESFDGKTVNSPRFFKHIFRASFESKVDEKLSFIASVSATQSFMKLYNNDSDLYNENYQAAIDLLDSVAWGKKQQRRAIYNFFGKVIYDISDDLNLEVSYTYAPQFDKRFMLNSPQNQFYNWNSGGHQVGGKLTWYNSLGVLTNQLGYSYLHNTAVLHNYDSTKYWAVSATKNWGIWASRAREGGHAPGYNTQHTISEKIVQDFLPLEIVTPYVEATNLFQIGAELGYQKAFYGFTSDYFVSAVNSPRAMTQEQQALCLQTDMKWCDPNPVYDVRSSNANNLPAGAYEDYKTTADANGRTGYYLWKYGQFFKDTSFLQKGENSLDNAFAALFLQNDLRLDFKKFGVINARYGVRLDGDTYMEKLTAAPRFSASYLTPAPQAYQTQLTFGANRYYGRNMFAYALNDRIRNSHYDFVRDTPALSWYDILASGVECSTTVTTNCYETQKPSIKFSELKIPYVDELMVGIAQRVKVVDLGAKYINRKGKDEVRYISRNTLGLAADDNYTNGYYTYSNEGKSWTEVVTFTIENNEPLKFANVSNFFLLAFDYTQVRRNFISYADSMTDIEYKFDMVLWNGKLIPLSERPADNFVRPWTLRLNTTTNFEIGKTKWLWSNFFRYRAGYHATASTNMRNYVLPDGSTATVRAYKEIKLPYSFTWDMRVGFEVDIYKGNTFFMNVDILNVENRANVALTQSANYTTGVWTPIYELGRQFWLQVGYKY